MEQTCGCGFHIAVLQYQIWVVVVAVLHQLDIGVCAQTGLVFYDLRASSEVP